MDQDALDDIMRNVEQNEAAFDKAPLGAMLFLIKKALSDYTDYEVGDHTETTVAVAAADDADLSQCHQAEDTLEAFPLGGGKARARRAPCPPHHPPRRLETILLP